MSHPSFRTEMKNPYSSPRPESSRSTLYKKEAGITKISGTLLLDLQQYLDDEVLMDYFRDPIFFPSAASLLLECIQGGMSKFSSLLVYRRKGFFFGILPQLTVNHGEDGTAQNPGMVAKQLRPSFPSRCVDARLAKKILSEANYIKLDNTNFTSQLGPTRSREAKSARSCAHHYAA